MLLYSHNFLEVDFNLLVTKSLSGNISEFRRSDWKEFCDALKKNKALKLWVHLKKKEKRKK